MGAESSVQRDGKSQEEDASATATASGEEVKVQEGDSVPDTKSLQKNGQISSMSSLNGHSEDTTLAEVGQPDGVSVAQKEEAPETMDAIQDEVAPQVNGEKVEKDPTNDANDISVVEEKAAEEKTADASEVGFKKIFRFVGFKFTLKKDKSEEKDPVKLLTIKDKDADEVVDEAVKEEEAATVEEKEVDEKESEAAAEAEVTKHKEKAETTDGQAETAEGEATEEATKEEKPEKEGETAPASQEVISPFRKIFSGGLFSNLRKKASIKKTKEEEEVKEEAPKAEETAAGEEEKTEQETKEEAPEESAVEDKEAAAPASEGDKPTEEAKSEEAKETASEEEKPETVVEGEATAETTTDTTDEAKPEEEKAALEVSSEAELLSSQEKAKPHGSPLKKLFTGAGLKKLSTKKQKTKKDAETKPTESGEQAEQLQLSTESAEAPKAESGPSSPEESGEHVITVEVTQNEASQETDGEVTSDGEKKKEGIIAWSSFKKLVTPKKRVKRPSESDDEAAAEKPAKSATLSSTESATLADKSSEEEAKEEKAAEEEPKTETTEKLTSSTEEKKKMDTSVSWEALMCMGGAKKRTRKTSDSDDDETKVEEEPPTTEAEEGEQEAKIEAAAVTTQTSENEGEVVSSPEPVSPPASAWDTLKRMAQTLKRTKSEEKPEESAEQVLSDSEAPKEESSFFLKKFFPGRRKKKAEKQSAEQGSGEEDSDTPAVVPLSEYDEPAAEAEQEKPAEEPPVVQTKVTAEERSPSWISAAVEDDKQDQLSDIPEEVESAATPKSVDTDIAEDEEQAPVSPKSHNTGRRLSTAEVKPMALTPSSETTSVPKSPELEKAQEVLQSLEAQNSEIPAETSVAVEDAPVVKAEEKIEFEPPTETADEKTNAVLEVHARDEAMAICTGLGTKEIAKVTLEKPVSPVAECMAVVRDALATEVSVEEKPANSEQATMSEDPLLEAQIHQVDTTDLEPIVEKTPNGIADIQVATESTEPQIEKVGVVSTVLEGSEVVQPPTAGENSPKATIFEPVTPTSETAVCTESVEVTEPTVEIKEVEMDMEQLVATEENSPVKEVAEVVPNEISSAICNKSLRTTEETEPEIPVVMPSEVVPVIAETVVLVAPVNAEFEDVTAIAENLVEETASVSEPVVELEVSVAVEQANEKDAEGEIVQDTIETQSMVIAQNIIQDAVDKVTEDAPEPKKPSIPSPTIPTPHQAVATIEKDVEIDTETPIITETPVAVFCEKPLHVAMEVTDTIPIEVTGSIEASEEKKPEELLKQDKEVKVSEETVAEEEEAEESAKVEPEQSKDDAVVEEVENKVSDSDALPEDTQSKSPELHMPVQVVLQTAQVLEEPSVEEEAVVEIDSNGPLDSSTPIVETKTNGETADKEHLSTVSEEPQEAEAAAADSQSDSEKPSGKCAEVMAQVMEVIEEAVKEIEPVSTEITAAS